MAIKGYSTIPKAPVLLESHHQIFCVVFGHSLGEFYPSAEMQPVYSTIPADWADKYEAIIYIYIYIYIYMCVCVCVCVCVCWGVYVYDNMYIKWVTLFNNQ